MFNLDSKTIKYNENKKAMAWINTCLTMTEALTGRDMLKIEMTNKRSDQSPVIITEENFFKTLNVALHPWISKFGSDAINMDLRISFLRIGSETIVEYIDIPITNATVSISKNISICNGTESDEVIISSKNSETKIMVGKRK